MSDDQFAKGTNRDQQGNSGYEFKATPFESGLYKLNLPDLGVTVDKRRESVSLNEQGNSCIPEGVNVYFYAQNHGHIRENTPLNEIKIDKEVVKNQFNLVHFIMKHSDALIFPEGATPDHNIPNNLRFEQSRNNAKKIFPNGFPKRYEDLNLAQKKFLQIMNGARVAYLLGIVDKVYPPNSVDVEKRVASIISQYGMSDEVLLVLSDKFRAERKDLKPIPLSSLRKVFKDPFWNLNELVSYYKKNPNAQCPKIVAGHLREFSQAIFSDRENDVLRRVAQVTNMPENKGKDVVVIYGAAHQARLVDLFGSNLEEVTGCQYR